MKLCEKDRELLDTEFPGSVETFDKDDKYGTVFEAVSILQEFVSQGVYAEIHNSEDDWTVTLHETFGELQELTSDVQISNDSVISVSASDGTFLGAVLLVIIAKLKMWKLSEESK